MIWDLAAFTLVMVLSPVLHHRADYRKRWPAWYWYFWYAFCGLLCVAMSRALNGN
jgi:hypothetical protein